MSIELESRRYEGPWQSALDVLDWLEETRPPADQPDDDYVRGVAIVPPNSSENRDGSTLYIYTLSGGMRVEPGDWVVRGVDAHYARKPDAVVATHGVAE